MSGKATNRIVVSRKVSSVARDAMVNVRREWLATVALTFSPPVHGSGLQRRLDQPELFHATLDHAVSMPR
jgi:hypothetical protein